MTEEAFVDAIFGGPPVDQAELEAFLAARGIRFPSVVTTIPEGSTAKAPMLRLHGGVAYRFDPAARTSHKLRASPTVAWNAGEAIHAIRQSILVFRRLELAQMGHALDSELSFQAETQAFHLAMQEIREQGSADSEAMGVWLDIVLHRHQNAIHRLRRKLIEFISQITRGVDAELSFPFSRAVRRILDTYQLTELAAVLNESVQEILQLIGGRLGLREEGLEPKVRRALAFMEEHYAGLIGLKEVAEAVHASSGHLARLFKKETGRTVVEQLHLLRLARAKELLATTDQTILEIALESGFPAIEHFHRVFRRLTGLTPRAYRLSCTGAGLSPPSFFR